MFEQGDFFGTLQKCRQHADHAAHERHRQLAEGREHEVVWPERERGAHLGGLLPFERRVDGQLALPLKSETGPVELPREIVTEPILNPVTKAEHRVRIDMVDGFEYTLAEMGRGWTKVSHPIKFELADSYAQFAEIHLCQDGIVH